MTWPHVAPASRLMQSPAAAADTGNFRNCQGQARTSGTCRNDVDGGLQVAPLSEYGWIVGRTRTNGEEHRPVGMFPVSNESRFGNPYPLTP